MPHSITEMVINKPLNFVTNLSKADIFENMRLTNLGHARVKCALLSLKVLKMGVVSTDRESNLAKEFQNCYNWHISLY
jgi:nitrogen fixation protein NifU and related proteins